MQSFDLVVAFLERQNGSDEHTLNARLRCRTLGPSARGAFPYPAARVAHPPAPPPVPDQREWVAALNDFADTTGTARRFANRRSGSPADLAAERKRLSPLHGLRSKGFDGGTLRVKD